MKTRFILINTSHAGNVGAAARAMKVMGFDDLVLVAPRWANVLRREETIQRASGALDVLANARIVPTLDEALDGITHLCATAMTPRDFGPPTRSPRAHFSHPDVLNGVLHLLHNKEHTAQYLQGLEGDLPLSQDNLTGLDLSEAGTEGRIEGGSAEKPPGGIGFLFGSERFGMRNEDVYRCHVCLQIPTNPKFGSLNLGAALQVIAYEWRLALGGFAEPIQAVPVEASVPKDHTADAQQVAGLLAHLEQSLTAIGFLDPAAPKKLMPRLNQLFNRAGVTTDEVHILRGIAKMMLRPNVPGMDGKTLPPAATASNG